MRHLLLKEKAGACVISKRADNIRPYTKPLTKVDGFFA